jgi:hypothetical protein
MYVPSLFPSSTDQLNNVLSLWRQKMHVLRRRMLVSIPEKQSISIEQLLSFLYIRIRDFIILLFLVRFNITKSKSCKFLSENLLNGLGIEFNLSLVQ